MRDRITTQSSARPGLTRIAALLVCGALWFALVAAMATVARYLAGAL